MSEQVPAGSGPAHGVLDPAQQDFLRQRHLMRRNWPVIAPLLVGALMVFMGVLLLTAPLLLNPFAVLAQLREGTLNLATLQTMAMMLPFVLLLFCLTLLALIGLAHAGFRRERRYLEVTDRLLQAAADRH